jgi:hypothetical protein
VALLAAVAIGVGEVVMLLLLLLLLLVAALHFSLSWDHTALLHVPLFRLYC